MGKIAGVTDALSKVRIGKDPVSRIVRRLEEEQRAWGSAIWRKRPTPPYLYPSMPPT